MKVQELIHRLSAEHVDPAAEVIVSVFGIDPELAGQAYARITFMTSEASRVTVDVEIITDIEVPR